MIRVQNNEGNKIKKKEDESGKEVELKGGNVPIGTCEKERMESEVK